MANAPVRPPAYRAGRRPPKGLRRVTRPLRDRLKTAAGLLRQDGHDEAAIDLETVLAPGGWTLLRAKDSGETTTGTNLALTVDRDVRDLLKARAEEFGITLGSIVAEGFEKVLSGDWVPPRLAPIPAEKKVMLNVRVDDSLRKRVDAQKDRLSTNSGYRVNQTSIAIGWLAEELGVEIAVLDPDTSAPKRRKMPPMLLPKKYEGREMWTADQCAQFRGSTKEGWEQMVEDGQAPRPVWRAPGEPVDILMWDAESVRSGTE